MPRRAKEIIETRVQIKGNPETRREINTNPQVEITRK